MDSVESAVNAERGGEARRTQGRGQRAAAGPVLTRLSAGAGRIELCAGLVEGGTTPSMGECMSPAPGQAQPSDPGSLLRPPFPSPPPPVARRCRSRC